MKDFDAYSASDPRPVLLVDTRRTVLGHNNAARNSLRGLTVGWDLGASSADPPQLLSNFLQRCSGTRGPVLTSLRFIGPNDQVAAWRCDGGLAHVGSSTAPASVIMRLRAPADAHAGFLALKEKVTVLNRELHHRRMLQAQLEEALHSKNILLAELNHRVKNNLQVIISMLGLAASDKAGPVAFQQTAERIRAMGKVHELLFESGGFGDVHCPSLLATLAGSIEAVHRRSDVKLEIECDSIRLDADRATSVALLINELVSNAFKHAFPDARGGSVRVRLSNDDGTIALTVTDNGVPMPSAVTSRTGMRIARALAEKLGGTLHTTHEPIKAFGVAFPAE